MKAEGQLGMRGDLRIRVIRHHPTLRQRITDWLVAHWRF